MYLCFFLCSLLVCCAKPEHYQNQFVRNRSEQAWSLDDYSIHFSEQWEEQLQAALQSHCSASLEHYLLYSSDIIEAHHTVTLRKDT